MKIVRLVLAAASLAVAPFAQAQAQDAISGLSLGSLVFVPHSDLEIRGADYFISADEVRIRYRLFNKGSQDIKLQVSFPLPEIRIDDAETLVGIPTDDPVNVFGFQVKANGQPVTPQIEQRAMVAGVDRAPLLKSLGIPLAPHLNATNEALDKLPAEKWPEIANLGLAEVEEYGPSDDKLAKHLTARWGLQSTYHWQQVYKAQAETVIEASYKPSLGITEGTNVGAADTDEDDGAATTIENYCIDKEVVAAIEKARKAAKRDDAPYDEQTIDVGLANGANFSTAIKEFRVVIDKGKADNIVAFCGDDVKKISPTQVEMRKTDFLPEGELSVLILQKQEN